MLIKCCSCTWFSPAQSPLCSEPRAWPLTAISPTLSVLVLSSGLAPLAAYALRRSHPEMTTWLVRLTVLL